MKKYILSAACISALVFGSCSSDDDSSGVDAPSTYTFSRDGQTTVSYSGQTTRIAMAEEIIDALKDESLTEETIDAMFAHIEGASDFSDTTLNASDKSVRSKTAASFDYFSANTTQANAIKADFDGWIAEQVSDVFPNYGVDASAGVAGGLQEAGGGSTRYINGNGVELNQLFAKALIGGLMADQILNNYLGTGVLDAGTNIADNDAGILDGDNNYTSMEHKWDEAFGYLYGAEVSATAPVLDVDSFLNKYLDRVRDDEDFAGIEDDIYDAFILGRAAIEAKDYDVRDEQAEYLREKISEVIAIRTVFYLQQGKALLGVDNASAFHDLSEGLGFLYSLQFTRQPNSSVPYFSRTVVEGYLSDLLDVENGLWHTNTADTLETISQAIAAEFDFTVEQAGS